MCHLFAPVLLFYACGTAFSVARCEHRASISISKRRGYSSAFFCFPAGAPLPSSERQHDQIQPVMAFRAGYMIDGERRHRYQRTGSLRFSPLPTNVDWPCCRYSIFHDHAQSTRSSMLQAVMKKNVAFLAGLWSKDWTEVQEWPVVEEIVQACW